MQGNDNMKKNTSEDKTCYIYTRVSTAIQVDGYSLEAQRDRLIKEADHRGYIVIGEYSDEGKSGKNITGRPDFQRMLEDIQSTENRPDYVYVFKLSRFGRNAADTLNSLQFLEDYGVSLLCVEDGIDSSGAAGKLMISIYAAVAEAERENIKTQTMAGRYQKAREGKWNGGFAPYGYTLVNGELLIAEDEADLVREIFDMYTNQRMGINAVAKRLEAQGKIKKVRNNANTNRISYPFVKGVLDNPVYAGYIAYGRHKNEKIEGTRNEFHTVKQSEYELYDGIHEAIISKELWEQTRERRKENGFKHEKTHSLDHCHLLSGILKCPICGAPMYGNVNRKKKKGTDNEHYTDIWYYVCKNRRMVAGKPCTFRKYIRQDELNDYVLELIGEIFSKLNNMNDFYARDFLSKSVDLSEHQKNLDELSERRNAIEKKRSKLFTKIREMDADDPCYDEMFSEYNCLIREFTKEIAEIDSLIEEAKQIIDTNSARAYSVEQVRKVVTKMWQNLDTLPDKTLKLLLNEFIDEIHIKEEPEIFGSSKYWIDSIKFKFPSYNTQPDKNTIHIDYNFQPKENNVESICLMSREKPHN